MTLLDKIIRFDKELMVQLNGLGTESWDQFWLLATNQLTWIPLYLIFFYLIFKSLGWKKGLALVLLTAVLVTFSDQFTVFLKDSFERLRPNNDPSVNSIIRILKNNKSFSFVSGHATTSMAVSTLMFLTLRKSFSYSWLFFIWPLVFAYSRIYIGVHFPMDVLCGALLGAGIGYLFYRLSLSMITYMDRRGATQP
ncbi:MAG: phosphatase PAP2 family protein [Lutimonas sp.]